MTAGTKDEDTASPLWGPLAAPSRPTRAERAATGRAARVRMRRSAQAEVVTTGRADPVDLLEQQAATRVPELVPIRYGRMSSSEFAFYRGAALVMARDLAAGPNSGIIVQLCGDAHLSNFGVYNSPERRLVFDINDFDETHPGPFEWDVKRLAASVTVAARANGFGQRDVRESTIAAVRGYRQAMERHSTDGNLTVWYSHLPIDEVLASLRPHLDSRSSRRMQASVARMRTRDSVQALAKLTEFINGRRHIVNQPPLIVPVEDIAQVTDVAELYGWLNEVVKGYRRTLQWDRRHLLDQFELRHVARKVVGVGSVGTRAWILLFEGIDGNDPLFLQAKEAQPSVLSGLTRPTGFKNQGQRVVAGQQLMQATSDIFLGWQRTVGIDGLDRDFYVRQLRDGKGSVVIENLGPREMGLYAELCGGTLARAHARSGDRVAISAYLGSGTTFEEAVADFAETYADLNSGDHAALLAAIDSGRIKSEPGI